MSRFAAVLTVCAAADVLVAILALWMGVYLQRRGDRRKCLSLAVAVAAAGLTTAFFVVKLVVLQGVGLDFFGVLHLVYVDLAVVVPLLGAMILVAGRARVPGLGRVRVARSVVVAACLALVPAPVAAYATLVEPYRLTIEEASVAMEGIAPSAGDVTVAVLADLQFSHIGDHERRAVSMVMELGADIIVLPGDLFQGSDGAFHQQLDDIRVLLGRLDAPGGVYLVVGNCDTPQRLRQSVVGTNVVFLMNDTVRTEVRGFSVLIGGVEFTYDSPAARRTIRRLRTAAGKSDIRLLLAHRPDVALGLDSQSGVDLVIAGHTHGGQVQIPGWGPPITFSRVPRAAAAGGLSIVNGTPLYVSRGVGLERGQAPPLRLFCPPEVSLLTLTAP